MPATMPGQAAASDRPGVGARRDRNIQRRAQLDENSRRKAWREGYLVNTLADFIAAHAMQCANQLLDGRVLQ
jgi:hypothetical protein